MNEFSFKTSKGEILRSMMERPETAKLLKEAMNSPVGSTSRAKARKIFSIMNKLSASNDGAGGPGFMPEGSFFSVPQIQEQIQVSPETAKNVVIFNRIPKPRIVYGKRINRADGAGGPGVYDGAGGNGIVDYLSGQGKDSSYSARARLAAEKGISGYSGTAAQNTQLLNLLKGGSQQPQPSTTYGPAIPSGFKAQAPVAPQPVNIQDIFKNIPSEYTAAGVSKPEAVPVANQPMTIAQSRQPAQTTVPALLQPVKAPGSQIIPGLKVSDVPKWTPPKSGDTNFLDVRGTGQPTSGQYTIAQSKPTQQPTQQPAPVQTQPTGPVPVPVQNPAQDQYSPSPENIQAPTQQNLGSQFQMGLTGSRTDRHNNPAAFTTDIAKQAGLVEGVDYVRGDAFPENPNLFTARLLGDPIATTIKVIDSIGFQTQSGANRWTYTDEIPGANNQQWPSLTPEQKTQVIAQMYQHENGGASGGLDRFSGVAAAAKAAVSAGTGAGMFAMNQMLNPNDPITHGKTMEQIISESQKALWDKYNIGELQSEENRLRLEGALLPKEVTAYITARDEYLHQTDTEIDRFIQDSLDNTDLSNPANAAKANAQLNYLYTLRGRQNQTYIGYLTDAVNQHQAGLDHVSNLYSTALTAYETDLKNSSSITEGQYKMYASALADMYTAVEEAPLKALQMQTLEQQMIDAHTQVVTDNLKAQAQGGYIEQYPKLKQIGFISSDNFAQPGTNLVDSIQKMQVLDPTIQPANIIQAYTSGVLNYLSAPLAKDATTGTGITAESKRQMAEEAIQQFANLSIAGSDNPNTVLLGQQSANEIAQKLANQIGSTITTRGKAPQYMEAVKTLAPRGWFSAKKSPSMEEFVKTVAGEGGDTLDESIARAIYAVFLRYVQDNGNTTDSPQSAVNALLYSTSSTSDRSSQVAFTPEQFAQNIGTIYASNILDQAFSTQ